MHRPLDTVFATSERKEKLQTWLRNWVLPNMPHFAIAADTG